MRSHAAPIPTAAPDPDTHRGCGARGGHAALVSGALPVPDLTGALEDASRTLGAWAYPAVGAFAFLETGAFVGLVVPGETAVVVGGVVAANGDVELVPMIALVWLAAAAGDLVSFLLGRRLGRPFLERHGPRVRIGPERLGQVERFYARHGGSAVLLGRFVGIVRAVSPFVAGASGLELRRFVPWSLAGTLAWAATFTLVGYGFSESFADSGETAARIALGAALVAAAGYAAVIVLRARSGAGRARAGRARAAARRGRRARRARRRSARPRRRRAGSARADIRARAPRRRRSRARRGEAEGTGSRWRSRRRRPWRCDRTGTRGCPESRSASRDPGRPPAGGPARRPPSGRP